MRFIEDLQDGDRIIGIYLCKYKKRANTKTGKPYDNVELQDKTGVVSAKIWDPFSPGIDDFEEKDYVEITGEVLTFNSAIQVNIKRARKAGEGEYDPKNYFAVSSYDSDDMYKELLSYVDSIENSYLKKLANMYFREDRELIDKFVKHSAAKSVHHGFIGGLMEHTLSVTRFCDYLAKQYRFLRRDLMIMGGLFHDIGKLEELTAFPANDYTNVGQLIGHIVTGTIMLSKSIDKIEGFPDDLRTEFLHCILAHHGELEYGSPKKPAMAEALALNIADSADAKLEIMKELLQQGSKEEWLGYNKFFESNIKRTTGLDKAQ